jgi:flagellar basal-body rod protein FlgG
MIYGLYLSANGLVTQGMRADVISNNLANSSTPGFKKDFLALRQRDPEVLRQGAFGRETQRHLLAIGGAVEGSRSHSIFEQGAMKATGNVLDVAINGSGFFKAQDDQGKIYYTRNGAFTLNNEGILTMQNGMPVLNFDNGLIEIGAVGDLRIDEMGRVIADGEAIDQIGLVDVSDPDALHKVGENLFEAVEPVQEEPANTIALLTGHLEASSVSPIREMTALIEAQRAYQANAKLIGIQDDTLGKAISQIAT